MSPRPRVPSRPISVFLRAMLTLILLAVGPASGLAAETGRPIRIALNDLPGKGMLPIMVAIEHMRERGLDIEVSYLNSENIVLQALAADLADIGMGTPYKPIQDGNLPVRMFFQLSRLAFFPVVNTEFYQDWADLDGIEMYAHGPGSGTEALLNVLAERHGIRYSKMNYLPGSGTRAHAMLSGRIKATVLDAERKRMVLAQAPERFKVLPMGDVRATDEALFASETYIATHHAKLEALIATLLDVWARINADPAWLAAERDRLGLLADMDAGEIDRITPYIEELVTSEVFAADGGVNDVPADFAFYTASGTLKGDAASLKEEMFWDLGPLRQVLKARH